MDNANTRTYKEQIGEISDAGPNPSAYVSVLSKSFYNGALPREIPSIC